MDEKAEKVLRAIRRKIRPYTEADISMACGLSKAVVRKRLRELKQAGLVDEKWVGTSGPYWEVI